VEQILLRALDLVAQSGGPLSMIVIIAIGFGASLVFAQKSSREMSEALAQLARVEREASEKLIGHLMRRIEVLEKRVAELEAELEKCRKC